MRRRCRSLQLRIGLCGLLFVSLYIAFDWLDVDGSNFRGSSEIVMAQLEDAPGKQSQLLTPDPGLPLSHVATPVAPAPHRMRVRFCDASRGCRSDTFQPRARSQDSGFSEREVDPA